MPWSTIIAKARKLHRMCGLYATAKYLKNHGISAEDAVVILLSKRYAA